MTIKEIAEHINRECADLPIGKSKVFTIKPALSLTTHTLLQLELAKSPNNLAVSFNDTTCTIHRIPPPTL